MNMKIISNLTYPCLIKFGTTYKLKKIENLIDVRDFITL